jgi:PAS domain S-box-containing protein
MTVIDCPPWLDPACVQFLNALFETSPGVCILLDAHGRIQKLNRCAEQLTGYSQRDLLGLRFVALLDTGWVRLVERRLAEATHDAPAGSVVTPWRTRSGDTRMVEWRCRRVPGARNAETHILLAGTDVTDLLSGQADATLHDQWLGTCHDLPFIGMATLAPDTGLWVHFNPRFLEMLGYSREELAARSWKDVTHPEDVASEAADYERAVRGEIPSYSRDKRFLHQSGAIVHTAIHVNPVRRPDGSLSHLIALVHDITQRKSAEAELRLQTAALEAAANGIVITEPDGRIRWVNRAFTSLTGYSLAEVHGQMPRLLRSGRQSRAFYAAMWDTIRQGKTWRGEIINRRKDGTLYEEEMTITPVLNAAGSIVNYIAIKSDISERKAAEEKLRDSESLYRSLMDNLPHCVFRKDREGRFTLVNRPFCETFGRPAHAIIGKTDFDLFPAEVAHKYVAGDQKVLTSGDPVTLHAEYDDSNGERRVAEIFKHPVYNHDGAITGLQGVFLDITDRVLAEAERRGMEIQLRHAQKLEAIGQLAAGIAHEINTPTQYIGDNTRFVRDAFQDIRRVQSCYADLLAQARTTSLAPELIAEIDDLTRKLDVGYLCEEIPAALEQSLDGVSRVAKIVHAMKDFSHPGNEEKTATDLNRAIESTLTIARNEWKYVAEMVMDLDPELPPVPCLPGEFNQVVLNLVTNAAHAIDDVVRDNPGTKGTITVSTRCLEDRVEVRVRDTGTGIPAPARSRVFDPFFTTKPVGKGTGQGLAIAHSVIVDKHGGTIRFETEMGQGTTFIVEVPLDSSVRRCPEDDTSQCAANLSPSHEFSHPRR